MLIKRYQSLVMKYPIRTKMVVNTIIFTLADIAIQKYIQNKKVLDFKRTIKFSLTGVLYVAPCSHLWYKILFPKISSNLFSKMNKSFRIISTVLIDQLIYAPIFLTGFYLFYSTLKINNDSILFKFKNIPQQGLRNCEQKLGETLMAYWTIWISSTVINSLLPWRFQLFFANLINLNWNLALSYIANNKNVGLTYGYYK